ncbi:phytoene/squalene synthase family protein [Marinilabiliaceae bacterium JC017]|nr:phytoene/squalene synthase family protein [Marinilabiliaceae bacterium JC017]
MENLYHTVSFKSGKLITQTYSTSFSIAVSMLSHRMRKAIYSIYGFVRLADEIVDTFLTYNQKELLDRFEEELYHALKEGLSMNPVIHAFVVTVNQYSIPRQHIQAFLTSMRDDLHKKEYSISGELNHYIYGSAEVVGLMCLRVFVNGNTRQYEELEEPARKLGAAFQKVNFLRDLKADMEQLNRTYFSKCENGTFDEAIKHELIEDIEQDFAAALPGIKALPGKSKIAVWVAYLYYRQLLRKLKITPAREIMHTRIRVKDSMKLFLFFRAYVSYKLSLI